jgi:hypothetical protein
MRVHLTRAPSLGALAATALLVTGCAGARSSEGPAAPPKGFDVDFLFSYYDQDGDHSAVTGGTGTENQQVLSPVVLVSWAVSEDWSLRADLGFDQITAASVDAIDLEISSASRVDQRAFADLTGTRRLGESSEVSYTLGLSNEYDYRSISGGLVRDPGVGPAHARLARGRLHAPERVPLDAVPRGRVAGGRRRRSAGSRAASRQP